MTDKIKPCLWFDGQAEEAATFYVSLLPDSRIDAVHRSPAEYPAGKEGDVLTVEFTLAGRSYVGLNGGAGSPFTQALSLQVDCDDQGEVDRIWEAMVANGGQPVACSWITDRWGLSWQIVPRVLADMITSPDRPAAARAMQAMMKMVKIDIPTLEKAFAGEG
jgi:predicted 3-demethylubiquinone-9 3-methyltransferase (glyoxalase superfamily)